MTKGNPPLFGNGDGITVDVVAQAKHVPGDPGFWIVLLGDLTMFSVMFVTFAFYRLSQADLFLRSQPSLHQALGLFNTLLLLTSSWLVVRAVGFVRADRLRSCRRALMIAMGCGVAFLVIKCVEYIEMFQGGFTPATNDFFMFYFALTGVHFVHVVIGLMALSIMLAQVNGVEQRPNIVIAESCALFWHLVDMIWVVMFTIFYLYR